MTKQKCTSKVQIMRHYATDEEVAKRLGILKPTLYVRLKANNWKVSEICLIEALLI